METCFTYILTGDYLKINSDFTTFFDIFSDHFDALFFGKSEKAFRIIQFAQNIM